MKTIYNATSKNNAFGNFIVTKKTCFGCKSVVNSGAVCKNCVQKLKGLFIERKLEVNFYERMYAGKKL